MNDQRTLVYKWPGSYQRGCYNLHTPQNDVKTVVWSSVGAQRSTPPWFIVIITTACSLRSDREKRFRDMAVGWCFDYAVLCWTWISDALLVLIWMLLDRLRSKQVTVCDVGRHNKYTQGILLFQRLEEDNNPSLFHCFYVVIIFVCWQQITFFILA